MQGESASAEIVAALRAAGQRAECDALILCRGGGSIEDLWAFNDERVARAIRASPIPIVVGVGHETDFTIADFAADVRAATPTAAAELASPPRDELLARIAALADRLQRRLGRDLETRLQLLDHLARRLVHPGRRLAVQSALLAQLSSRLAHAMTRTVERERWRLRDLVDRSRRRLPALELIGLRTAQLGARLRAATRRQLVDRDARLDMFGVCERYGVVFAALGDAPSAPPEYFPEWDEPGVRQYHDVPVVVNACGPRIRTACSLGRL